MPAKYYIEGHIPFEKSIPLLTLSRIMLKNGYTDFKTMHERVNKNLVPPPT